jgi:hypothetical protein
MQTECSVMLVPLEHLRNNFQVHLKMASHTCEMLYYRFTPELQVMKKNIWCYIECSVE